MTTITKQTVGTRSEMLTGLVHLDSWFKNYRQDNRLVT